MFISGCSEYDGEFYEVKFNKAFLEYLGISEINQDQEWGFENYNTRAVVDKWDMTDYPKELEPKAITQHEKEVVTEWFSNNPGFTGSIVNWDCFFIQHVSGKYYEDGVWHHYDPNRIRNGYDSNYWDTEFTQSFILDHLKADGEHVYDYNSTMGNKIVYMKNSSTKDFSCQLSWNNAEIHNYKMAEIEVDGEKGMYIGFSAWNTVEDNGTKELHADRKYYCDDWILKITPGKETMPGINGRIIVEDLLSQPSLKPRKSDWDYNDAVFDYNIQEDYTTITLLAAMGTIPLYIAEREVHEAFGTFPSAIVDTRKQTQYQPVTWKFKTISQNPNDIPIYIKTPQQVYKLTATKGHAPSKINVGQDFDWMDEGEHIAGRYPRFKEYAEKGEWKNNEWNR